MLEFINHGRIREIRLARPPVNALNSEFVKLLTRSLREAEADYNAVVLSRRDGSCIHSLHEPTYSLEPGKPVSSPANML